MLFAFLLEKVSIQLFSLQLCVNSGANCLFNLGVATCLGGKFEFKPIKLYFKKLALYHILHVKRDW